MFKCNICSNDAQYIYGVIQNRKNREIKIDGKTHYYQLLGHIFLCKDHYVEAVDEKW